MKDVKGWKNRKRIFVVCDNTLGIPGMEIDDGLALLYLCGLPQVELTGILTTFGNAGATATYRATRQLAEILQLTCPIIAGRAQGEACQTHALGRATALGHTIVSLGATSELGDLEHERPGSLARAIGIHLMGGITSTLMVGGSIMNELNFSVDAHATARVFAAASATRGKPAQLHIADAQDCLGMRFGAQEFLARVCLPKTRTGRALRQLVEPWFERARSSWGVNGFIGWDVLAAVSAAEPELVELVPYDVALNDRFFEVGLLEQARTGVPSAQVELVRPRNCEELCAHVMDVWQRAVLELG
ncbi:MAG: nucleoside hydrolase [Atopobiaceae bacterium]|jgi:purine nucleosidase